MSRPIKTLPIAERWDCRGCGICCRGAAVLLNEGDLQRLREQHWENHPDFRGKKILVRMGWGDRRLRLAHRKDGTCIFQDADKLCRIHREFGYEAKPHICRMAPLQMIPVDQTVLVTLRRYCPSAAADDGRTLDEQLDAYRRLAVASDAIPKPTAPPKLTSRYHRPWQDTLPLIGVLEKIMLDERYPLVRRLVHALEFCRLFDACRLKKLESPRLRELLSLLQTSALESVPAFFENREPPNRSGSRLFRQAAVEYLRLHPDLIPETTWRERGRMIQAAWAFARGKGTVPTFRMDVPPATFADLERPLGVLPPEVLRPLTRYFEAATASLRYVMFKGGRWSIVEGFQALALGFPVALWILRLLCGSRVPEKDDMVKVVMMLDRGETTAYFLGMRHRWRINALTNHHQLSRLAVWYAQ